MVSSNPCAMKYSFLLALLLSLSSALAQNFRIYESEVMPMASYKKPLEKHLFSDETGHYLYFKGYEKKVYSVVLEKYSPDFKLLFSRTLPAPEAEPLSLGAHFFDKGFAVIRNEEDSKSKQIRYSLTPVSMEGEAGTAVPLTSLPNKKNYAPVTKMSVSPDGSHLLFASFFDQNKAGLNFEIALAVVGAGMKVVWEKRAVLPQNEAQISLDDVGVDNDGVAYAMAKVYRGEKDGNIVWENDQMVQGYDMTILRFTADAAQPQYLPLRKPGAYIKSASFAVAPEGYLSAVGMYATDLKEPVSGVLLLELDPETGEVLGEGNGAFPAGALQWMDRLDVRKGKEAENGFREEFLFGEMYFEEDGGLVATARQHYIVVVSNKSGPSTFYYYSKYLLHVRFGSTGFLDHVTVIPRYCFSTLIDQAGYQTLRSQGKTYFFYNDENLNFKEPVEKGPIEPIVLLSNDLPVVASVDRAGKLARRPLRDAKEPTELVFSQNMCGKAGEGVLFYGTVRFRSLFTRDLKIGRVVLN